MPWPKAQAKAILAKAKRKGDTRLVAKAKRSLAKPKGSRTK